MSINKKKIYQYSNQGMNAKGIFEVSSFDLGKACVANESEVSEHYKIFWIEDGAGTYQIDFKSFSIEGSGLFFLSPGQIFHVESEAVTTGFHIAFDKDFYCVESHGKEIACNGVLFNNVHKATFVPLGKGDNPIFQDIFLKMIVELKNSGPAQREMLESYLRILLVQALRRAETKEKLTGEEKEPNNLVGDFIALVDKHYRTKHSVAEYAELLYITPKSLAKRLNALNYKTPTELIRDRIVLQAKRDLRYTDKAIKEIAFDLGFDDPGYFTRLFKKSEQVSPQQYRSEYLVTA